MEPTASTHLHAVADPGQQADYLLFYDELTGLYNRRFYNRTYAVETQKAELESTSLALILIDLDFFKSINDTYGHHQGDFVLSQAGQVIKDAVGVSGYPIRYAGDEFVVLAPGKTEAEAIEIAEALVNGARKSPFKLQNTRKTVKMTFSVGVAHYPQHMLDPNNLFESADRAAYQSKRAGRDRVSVYEPKQDNVLDVTTLYHYFPCPRLIARDELVQRVVESIGQRDGTPTWMVVEGCAGVGKSRILREVRARVDPQRRLMLEAAGVPYRINQPFGFLVDALSSLLRARPEFGHALAAPLEPSELAAISKLLPDVARHAIMAPTPETAPPPDPHPDRDPLLEAFYKMLASLGQGKVPPIIFDDFQWADGGTIRVLEMVSERDPSSFGCFTVRNEDPTLDKNPLLDKFLATLVERGRGVRTELAPFGPEHVIEMAEAILPEAGAHQELAELLFEKSRGVPLLVEEVLKYLINRKCISYDDDHLVVTDLPTDQIPTEPEQLLSVRAEQADEEIRNLMARAAVIGQEFDFGTLQTLEGVDEGYLRGILERARKAHIISEEWTENSQRIRFVSAQTHQAFYNHLAEEERKKLHVKTGKLRERQFASELDAALSELAFHFNRGGESDRAGRYQGILSQLYGRYTLETTVLVGRPEDVKDILGEDVLSPVALEHAVDLVRALRIAQQNVRMYGSEHVRRKGGYEELLAMLETVMAETATVTYSEAEGQLLINGNELPPDLAYGSVFAETLQYFGMKALTLRRGLSGSELRAFLDLMCLNKDDVRSRGGIRKMLADLNVTHIIPNEKIYVLVGDKDILLKRSKTKQQLLIKDMDGGSDAKDGTLDEDDLATLFRSSDTPVSVSRLKESLDRVSMLLENMPEGEGDGEGSRPALDTAELRKLLDAQREVTEWYREISRYIDMNFLQAVGQDWAVLQKDLESGHRIKIAAAAKSYVETGEEAIDPLVRVIATTQDARARRVAVALLRKVTPDAMDRILEQLHAAQVADEKGHFILALEDFHDAGIAGKIEPFVVHPVREIRRAALQILTTKKHGNLGQSLLDALHHEREDVRCDAIAALGRLRSTLALMPLLKMVAPRTIFSFEPNEMVQAQACQALGQMKDSSIAPALLEIVRRRSWPYRTKPPHVRAAACLALAHVDDPTFEDPIRAALENAVKERDTVVRSAAKVAQDRFLRPVVERADTEEGTLFGTDIDTLLQDLPEEHQVHRPGPP